MHSERLALAGLVVVLVIVGAVAWLLQLRPSPDSDASSLAALPLTLDTWKAEDVPLETEVERMLNADLNLQRTYRNRSLGPDIWLYVGYYGSTRGGRPEHVPSDCYPSAGWRIDKQATVDVDPARHLRANEFLVSQSGQERLVHFWYRSSGRTGILSAWALGLDHVRARLLRRPADGALIRLSTVIDSGREAEARQRLVAFGRSLDPLLAEVWPREATVQP